jgi:formate dehydrogenase major subunit
MAWDRLDRPGGLQWPCPTDDHPGTTLLHADRFGGEIGEKATLRPLIHRPSPEQPDDRYPLVLVTGRGLYQFNAGTMTRRSATQALRATDLLEISPEDAAALGIESGALVTTTSRYGRATLPVEVTRRVPAGTLFATFSDPATGVNQLTGPHRDPTTNTPEYKLTAVHLERAR